MAWSGIHIDRFVTNLQYILYILQSSKSEIDVKQICLLGIGCLLILQLLWTFLPDSQRAYLLLDVADDDITGEDSKTPSSASTMSEYRANLTISI